MASKIGIFDLRTINGARPTTGYAESAAPGLPVKAGEIIYQGCMVAYDPANSQAQAADPAMPATAKVVGFAEQTVDNRLGGKGDLTIVPISAVARVAQSGGLDASDLFTTANVVDDHTVGPLYLSDIDRPAGLIVDIDGDHVWLMIAPGSSKRGPVTLNPINTANGSDAATTQALANQLKTSFNALHAALSAHGIIAIND